MWVCQWEFWVIDNEWFVSWPYSSQDEASNETINLIDSNTFQSKWNLCVVEVLWNYDNYSSSDEVDDD